MELLLGIFILIAFVSGWVLGYNDVPGIYLSKKDALVEDYSERALPNPDVHAGLDK